MFVDLPNFYSSLLRSGIDEDRKFLRDYFLYWMDFDRLAGAIAGAFSGIWVFYSGERFGPSGERIEGEYLRAYVGRINALQGVTARDANIPGAQREPYRIECPKCGEETDAERKSEKGVDASLVVHLFDTMDSWDIAYLLSGDADFVPAVASLRRRGKIVVGAGFESVAPALVRECYHYVYLDAAFVREDVAAYTLFREGGLVEDWLTGQLVEGESRLSSLGQQMNLVARLGQPPEGQERGSLELTATMRGHFDLASLADFSSRIDQARGFREEFPGLVNQLSPGRPVWSLTLSASVREGIERRLREIRVRLAERGVEWDESVRGFEMRTEFNRDVRAFVPAQAAVGD